MTNTDVTFQFKVPVETFDATFRVDVFNLFAEKSVRRRNEYGTQGATGAPRGDYRFPIQYQSPRYVRLQLGFNF